jgi:hypothetical protein
MRQADRVNAMENISRAFEWIAVGVLILVFVAVARDLLRGTGAEATYRRGRGILVGLEVLVAADLMRTLAVSPRSRTLES